MRPIKRPSTWCSSLLMGLAFAFSPSLLPTAQAQNVPPALKAIASDIPMITADELEGSRNEGLWKLEADGLKLIKRARTQMPNYAFKRSMGYNDEIRVSIDRPEKSNIHIFFRTTFPKDLSKMNGYSLNINGSSARLVRWDEGDLKSITKNTSTKAWPERIECSIILDGPKMVAEIYDPSKQKRIASFGIDDATHDGPSIGLQFNDQRKKNAVLRGLQVIPSPKGNGHPIYDRDAYLKPLTSAYVVTTDEHAKNDIRLEDCRKIDADYMPGHVIFQCMSEQIDAMLDKNRMLPEPMRFFEGGYNMRDPDYRKASQDLTCKTPMHCDLSQPIDPNKSSKDVEMALAYLKAYVPQCQKSIKNVRLETIGRSYLGYPIMALVLSNGNADKARPRILFNGAHHGLELMSTDFVFDIIESLCENPKKNSKYKNYLDAFEIWAIPIVNPDGTDLYFHSSQSYGRKNGRDVFAADHAKGLQTYLPKKVGNPASYSTYMRTRPNNLRAKEGVDLNRNYPLLWGFEKRASSDKPKHGWYRGTQAGSEPETQAMMMLALSEPFMASISFHTVSNKILVPYSIDSLKNPEQTENYAWQMAEAMSLAAGPQKDDIPYEVVKNIYSVDGTDQDYFRYVTGSLAYLIEGAYHNPVGDLRREGLDKSRPAWETFLELSMANHIVKVSTKDGEPLIADVDFSDTPQLNGERWMTHCSDGQLAQVCKPGTQRQITVKLYDGTSQSKTVQCLAGQSQTVSFVFEKPQDYTLEKAICRSTDVICATLYGTDALCEIKSGRCPSIKAAQSHCLIGENCVKDNERLGKHVCKTRDNNRGKK